MEKLLYSVTEAAELAGIKKSKAYELVNSGEWPCVRIGSLRKVPIDGLRAWIAARTEGQYVAKPRHVAKFADAPLETYGKRWKKAR